jgi:hypothetical protein
MKPIIVCLTAFFPRPHKRETGRAAHIWVDEEEIIVLFIITGIIFASYSLTFAPELDKGLSL